MPDTPSRHEITTRIQQLLETSIPLESVDTFSVEQVRDSLTQSFDLWATARAEDSSDGQRPLWDLRMHDSVIERAAFIAWVWGFSTLQFACGIGNGYEVQSFCGARRATEVDNLFEEMRQRFRVLATPLTLPLTDVETWIGRKWPTPPE